MPTTDDDNLGALRACITREIIAAKQDFPDHHDALDLMAGTLDQIRGGMVPDFIALDTTTNGAVTRLLREDMRGIAEHGIVSSLITDAGAYLRFNVIFIDKLRLDLIELLAHKNRRMLDRRRIFDA